MTRRVANVPAPERRTTVGRLPEFAGDVARERERARARIHEKIQAVAGDREPYEDAPVDDPRREPDGISTGGKFDERPIGGRRDFEWRDRDP